MRWQLNDKTESWQLHEDENNMASQGDNKAFGNKKNCLFSPSDTEWSCFRGTANHLKEKESYELYLKKTIRKTATFTYIFGRCSSNTFTSLGRDDGYGKDNARKQSPYWFIEEKLSKKIVILKMI